MNTHPEPGRSPGYAPGRSAIAGTHAVGTNTDAFPEMAARFAALESLQQLLLDALPAVTDRALRDAMIAKLDRSQAEHTELLLSCHYVDLGGGD